VWGIISFHTLPVEAYPDVANNYVDIITQWPGWAAEEIEQQVTIPIETVMNGLPHLEHLRSTSLFGLSSVMLIFDDDSENDWNRQRVLERLSQVSLPQNLQPVMGTDWSPVGQIYFYTLHSTNPAYDVMELHPGDNRLSLLIEALPPTTASTLLSRLRGIDYADRASRAAEFERTDRIRVVAAPKALRVLRR